MEDRGFRIAGLGEVAIRCRDVAVMAAFYGEVLGLSRMPGDDGTDIVFFRISPGVAGHTTVLALFDRRLSRPGVHPAGKTVETGGRSSLHHVAFSLPFAEQDALIAHYDRLGLPYTVERFGWVGWRGVFTADPEGNTVEVVAFHESLLDRAPDPGP